MENDELIRILERCKTLVSLVTVRQAIEGGAEDAAGLNPWCINEGRAEGTESVSTWWITAAIDSLKEERDRKVTESLDYYATEN